MKKRKPPLILASFLIILVGGSIAFNPLSRKKEDPSQPPQQDQSEQQKIDAPRQPESPSATLETMKKQVSGAPPTSHAPGSPQGGPPGPPGSEGGAAPSIHIPKPAAAPTGPVQDPNRTTGQWYR